ncbi:MAG: DUF393 domain-containing protein [Ignavibacteriales bacterium]|nr:DUF393 domain-containing protein [Ignavibacteriales bacterium]
MKHYLLYDGVCKLCNGAVRFILRHEQTDTLLFSPLHSSFSQEIIKQHPELQNVDSVICVIIDESGKESFSIRSEAVFTIIRYVGGIWKFFLLFSVVPKPIRDYVYNAAARCRHRKSNHDSSSNV